MSVNTETITLLVEYDRDDGNFPTIQHVVNILDMSDDIVYVTHNYLQDDVLDEGKLFTVEILSSSLEYFLDWEWFESPEWNDAAPTSFKARLAVNLETDQTLVITRDNSSKWLPASVTFTGEDAHEILCDQRVDRLLVRLGCITPDPDEEGMCEVGVEIFCWHVLKATYRTFAVPEADVHVSGGNQ